MLRADDRVGDRRRRRCAWAARAAGTSRAQARRPQRRRGLVPRAAAAVEAAAALDGLGGPHDHRQRLGHDRPEAAGAPERQQQHGDDQLHERPPQAVGQQVVERALLAGRQVARRRQVPDQPARGRRAGRARAPRCPRSSSRSLVSMRGVAQQRHAAPAGVDDVHQRTGRRRRSSTPRSACPLPHRPARRPPRRRARPRRRRLPAGRCAARNPARASSVSGATSQRHACHDTARGRPGSAITRSAPLSRTARACDATNRSGEVDEQGVAGACAARIPADVRTRSTVTPWSRSSEATARLPDGSAARGSR